MVHKIVLLLIFTGLSNQIIASEKNRALLQLYKATEQEEHNCRIVSGFQERSNIPVILAQQAEAVLYLQSIQIKAEQEQATARARECAQESIFNNRKTIHRRSAAISPQSRHSLSAQTGIVVPEQVFEADTLQESCLAGGSDKISDQ